MGNEFGLPSVPRGLTRELTVYLHALNSSLLRLAGSLRGTAEVRAVRASEASTMGTRAPADGSISQVMLGDAIVTEGKLTDGAVTESKLAAGAVTGEKIAAGSVGGNALADGAVSFGKIASGSVTTGKLSDGAVTAAKLASGIVVSMESGEALDCQTIALTGAWEETPCVLISRFALPEGGQKIAEIGVKGLRFDAGVWKFDAAGNFSWVAIGHPVAPGMGGESDE